MSLEETISRSADLEKTIIELIKAEQNVAPLSFVVLGLAIGGVAGFISTELDEKSYAVYRATIITMMDANYKMLKK